MKAIKENEFSQSASSSAQTPASNTAPESEPWREGDKILLKRVFRILIKNAHDAQATFVRISIRQVRKNAVVRVSDNGAGMSPSEKENAFVPFKSTKGGRGVGLAVSKQIIRLHGGSLEIEETSQGKGTTMKMILPLCPS